MTRWFSVLVLALSVSACALDGVYWEADDGEGGVVAADRLSLIRDGEFLRLDGSPSDPGYVAVYPNIEGVDRMDVVIEGDGWIRPTCMASGQVTPCSATPFFSRAVRTEFGTEVLVQDAYGILVTSLVFESVPIPVVPRNGDMRPEGDDPEAPEEFADPDPDPDPDPEAEGGGGESSTTETPAEPETVGDGGCDFASIARDLCDRINESVSGFTLDCDTIDGEYGELPDQWEAIVEGLFGGGNPMAGFTTCEELVYGEGGGYRDEVLERCPGAGVDLTNAFEDARVTLVESGECRGSPLVLDLAGDGIRTTTIEEGVCFDLFGQGSSVRSAWLAGADDAFLAMDRDGNGRIQGGAELFGNGTSGGRFLDGFSALESLDRNGDGWVDSDDPDFSALRLWIDRDRDGQSESTELQSLEAAGIRALETKPRPNLTIFSTDVNGNALPWLARFARTDGTEGEVTDVFFRYTR